METFVETHGWPFMLAYMVVYAYIFYLAVRHERSARTEVLKEASRNEVPKEAEKLVVLEIPKELPKVYSKEDLRRDLLNPALAIDEILAKCKDMTPEEIEAVVKEVGSGDRRSERLAWYAKMLQQNAVLKVVPPPPPGKVVVAVKGSMEVCQLCADRRRNMGNYVASMYYDKGGRPIHPTVKCTVCNDTGYVVIQRG